MDNNEACLWHFGFVIPNERGGSWPLSTARLLGSGWRDQGPVGQQLHYGWAEGIPEGKAEIRASGPEG